MTSYSKSAGQFRIAITEADGALFQWRQIYYDRDSAERDLERAQAEFPTDDGHSAAVVQELKTTENDEKGKWVEVS